ncbi:MAG: bifunctional demethylmenaquinone methyltransferase/2-methoxy-6-polyprenyl-1,4-benzoquinol methylase UbiE [Desulfobacteraceae bacterium]|nr:bifunctional demethylmenaquinone methyltransferase/2-methoxy-6-polyprenyl-1,4-benzoquinol methylase UbiE [Desulfobacteraceae bacterium]
MNKNERPFIKSMFDTIAPWYDFLNRFLSLRQDVSWRRKAVKSLGLDEKNPKILDMACGTCDIGLEILRQNNSAHITAADFSWEMLKFSKKKISIKNKSKNFSLISSNALFSPFKNEIFDGVTIAFGIRNIVNRQKALENFYFSLKKGGKIAVLELTTPENRFLKSLYLLYFLKILPFIGGLFSKNYHAYSYLPESVINFPSSRDFLKIMKNAGFKNVKYKNFTFGICTLFTGEK